MVVPLHRLSTVGHRAFTVQGPMVWNSFPDDLRAQHDYESFRQRLKTWLFSNYYRAQRIRDLVTTALHKFTFTIPYHTIQFTSSVRLSIVVCSARLRHTWRISAHRSPILPVGGIYVQLAATSSSFHATVACSSAFGPSLLRVRWPGTHWLTASEMWLCQPALSDVI